MIAPVKGRPGEDAGDREPSWQSLANVQPVI